MSENVNEQTTLNDNQVVCIDALVSGFSHKDAALKSGVTAKTVSRWKSDPVFAAELQARQDELLANASRRLLGSLDLAVDTLRQLSEGKTVSDTVKRRAADSIVRYAVQLLEIAELSERLREVEKLLGVNSGS